jgi:hypothetical protein
MGRTLSKWFADCVANRYQHVLARRAAVPRAFSMCVCLLPVLVAFCVRAFVGAFLFVTLAICWNHESRGLHGNQ